MKILLKKEICGSREQYMEMEPTGTQLMLFKKKKKKKKETLDMERKCAIRTDT